jgi:hypothetical protein
LVKLTEDFAIFDNVLMPAEWDAVWSWFELADFDGVHRRGRDRAFQLSDGEPLRAPAAVHSLRSDAATVGRRNAPEIVLVASAIEECARRLPELVGTASADWSWFRLVPWIYQQGTALAWHADVDATGAFIYYVHREWNCRWGGELLVAEASKEHDIYRYHDGTQRPSSVIPSILDNTLENRVLLEHGCGQYIMPKPNRLVVIAGGVKHAIKRVEQEAGGQARCSISGTLHP